MKIFISSDMEGTAGVVDWEQCRAGGHDYEYYRGLLQGEVNAAIEGAMEAGADEFVVNDSHSRMVNLRPDELAGRARYLSGRHKPLYMMEGLDASYDGVFLVSYHGSMSTPSPLSHTYNPRAVSEVRLNGIVVGESGINMLVAQAYDVPVVLVTGDDVTAREAAAFCPAIHAAVVKQAVSRFAAQSLHPDQARELIRSRARAAVDSLQSAKPPTIAAPATLEVTWRNADLAAMATWVDGVARVGDTVVTMTDDDLLRLYRRFIVTVLLTREIAE